jgi:hypothetical protein
MEENLGCKHNPNSKESQIAKLDVYKLFDSVIEILKICECATPQVANQQFSYYSANPKSATFSGVSVR